MRGRLPEPDGPDDERFVYVVTTAGVAAVWEGAAAFDSERMSPPTWALTEAALVKQARIRETDDLALPDRTQ